MNDIPSSVIFLILKDSPGAPGPRKPMEEQLRQGGS